MLLYKKLTLKGAVLRACGDTMWRGIYFSAPGATLVTTSDSAGRRTQIWDADNGAKLEYSNGTYQLEKTDFVNNRVGVYVNQVKPNSSSYIRGCNFYTATDTQPIKKVLAASVTSYDSLKRNKTLFGVQLNLADGVVVGSAVECQSTQNRFFNLHCGMYSFSSGFTALNNSFEGSTDTAVTTVDDWWRTGIFANGDISPTRQQKIQIGDGSDCGMNRFYNGRFGICLKNNNASDTLIINRNRFTHAYLADVNINSAQNAPRVEVMYNSMDSGELAGDGIRALGCVNSALYIHHNFIVNVPLTKVYTAASPYPKRSCGIVVAGRTNSVANRALKIYENYVNQGIYGIYSLNNKAAQIFNNTVSTLQVPYRASSYTVADTTHLFSDNIGIMSTMDDSTVISSNTVGVTGAIAGFTQPDSLKSKVISVGVNSNKSTTLVYCNYLSRSHWGVVGFGTNTNGVNIRNNVLDGHWSGISIFGTNASIGNQGVVATANCQPLPSACQIKLAGEFAPDNRWINNTYHLGVYASANGSGQRMLLRENGIPAGLGSQVNPLLPSYCGNPGNFNSSLTQDVFANQFRFYARCATFNSTLHEAYSFNTCADFAGNLDELPKFRMAQIDWWERIAKGEDTITNILLAEDIRKWRQTELMSILLEHPELRDSSVVLDSFYNARLLMDAEMIHLKAIYEAANKTTDSIGLQMLYNENAGVYASGIQEQNMQILNNIYINYFANYLGTTAMPDSLKLKLKNIASQCYVTGGPSVFYARSLYWNCTNNVVWDFTDNCLYQTGFYKTNTAQVSNESSKTSLYFKIYPNPLDNTKHLVIEAIDTGVFELFNPLGQEMFSISLKKGVNKNLLRDISDGVYGYCVKLENGQIFNGKLVVRKW
ncbi:MAG: T9SS type A sorting domain-containing protein [Chitinophagales bacterium]